MMNFGREPYIMINIWLFVSPETGLHATKETPKYISPIMFPFILLNLTMKNHKNVKTRWSNFVLIWFFCVGSNVIWWKCFQLIAPDGPTHHCGFTENRTHKGTGGSFIKETSRNKNSPWKGNLNYSLFDVPKRKYLLNQIDFDHKNTTTFRSFFEWRVF